MVKTTITKVTVVPAKDRYSHEVQAKFLSTCKSGKGSTASCECVLHGQELERFEGEAGRSIAELFVLELAIEHDGATLAAAMNHQVPVPKYLASTLAACKNSRA